MLGGCYTELGIDYTDKVCTCIAHLVIVSRNGEGPQSQQRQDSRDNEEEAQPLLEALIAVGQVAVGAPICQGNDHSQYHSCLQQPQTLSQVSYCQLHVLEMGQLGEYICGCQAAQSTVTKALLVGHSNCSIRHAEVCIPDA